MLTIFKKLFGKKEAPVVSPKAREPLASTTPMPMIEVAHLSLAAITARFPEELRPLLAREPEEGATVALPMPTILKQLASGCVKMSLGTLQRQAHGLIQPLPPGDKRTVDVPLAEVFRHVRLSSLKRRPDQRPIAVPEIGYNLFGDSSNPRSIAPDDHLEQMEVLDLPEEEAAPEPAPAVFAPAAPVEPQRVLKMDDGLREHFGTRAPAPAIPSPAPEDSESAPQAAPTPTPQRILAPPPAMAIAKPIEAAPISKPTGLTLALPIASLAAAWPAEIREEIDALDAQTMVVLPQEEVAASLSKGRVTFSWAQLHAWLEPAAAPTHADPATALQLPLKIVAPAFLSATKKPAAERKSFAMDATIPALFNDGRAPAPAAPSETASAAAESEGATPTDKAPEASEAPAAPAAHPSLALTPSAPAPLPPRIPETLGEVFGQPQKRDWTPSEIVAGAVKLPGVAGAVVALQEGLQVAASLPDGVKSEVIAAFLPQIFARLNQYSGEMRLGEVDDLLFTTHGAHCQIYRLGYVYLAVLGKPGEPLPWHELRLISEELAKQTNK